MSKNFQFKTKLAVQVGSGKYYTTPRAVSEVISQTMLNRIHNRHSVRRAAAGLPVPHWDWKRTSRFHERCIRRILPHVKWKMERV